MYTAWEAIDFLKIIKTKIKKRKTFRKVLFSSVTENARESLLPLSTSIFLRKAPIAAISVSGTRHEAEQYFRILENNGRRVITESGIVTVRQPCYKSRIFVSDAAQGTRRGPVGASYLAAPDADVRHFSLCGRAARRVSRKSRISRLSRFRVIVARKWSKYPNGSFEKQQRQKTREMIELSKKKQKKLRDTLQAKRRLILFSIAVVNR